MNTSACEAVQPEATSLCPKIYKVGTDWQVKCIDLSIRLNPNTVEWIENQLVGLSRKATEHYLNDYRPELNYSLSTWGIPSPVVRLDMAPDTKGIFEMESNPAGMGVFHKMGNRDIVLRVADTLRQYGVTKVAWGVAPSRLAQREDLRVFMEALAMTGTIRARELHSITPEAIDDNEVLWLRAGQEDLPLIRPVLPRCLLIHQHGGGHKGYLIRGGSSKTTQAMYLSSYKKEGALNCEQIFSDFHEGFALKPKGGWGTRSTNFWCPIQPFKGSSATKDKMCKLLTIAANEDEEYIIQRFAAPDFFSGHFWIWRIYAVYDPSAKKYRLVGGFLAGRNSLRIHGADDTLNGIIRI